MSETLEKFDDEWMDVEYESEFIHLEDNESVVGVYVGKEQSDRYPNSYNHKLQVDGKVKMISGTVISRALENVEVGKEVRVTYLGKKKNDSGVMYHDYKVQIRREK